MSYYQFVKSFLSLPSSQCRESTQKKIKLNGHTVSLNWQLYLGRNSHLFWVPIVTELWVLDKGEHYCSGLYFSSLTERPLSCNWLICLLCWTVLRILVSYLVLEVTSSEWLVTTQHSKCFIFYYFLFPSVTVLVYFLRKD